MHSRFACSTACQGREPPPLPRVAVVTRVVVIVLAVAMVETACAERPHSGPITKTQEDAAERLKETVAATLEAKSFRVEVRAACPPGDEVAVISFDYVAPDRLRTQTLMCSSPLETNEQLQGESANIRIGESLYLSVPGRPGFFSRISVPTPLSVRDFLPGLDWALGAQNVEQSGEFFTFSFPREGLAPGGSGEARVSLGRLARLKLDYEQQEGDRVTDTYTFSMFGSVIIKTPPEARVVPFEPSLAPWVRGSIRESSRDTQGSE